jgi:hypothetical protein
MKNLAIALAVAGTLLAAVPASASVVPAKPAQVGVTTDITQARYYRHYGYRSYHRHHYYRHHYRRYY